MLRALWTAASGMEAQELNISIISNNLANVDTNGYKKSRVDFQDLLYQTIRAPGAPSAEDQIMPTGIEVGHGVKQAATLKIFSQGEFQLTNNPLDLVIEGDGFFQVLLPNGITAYTRAGAFKVDAQGQIVTSDGYLLQPALTIPAGATDIAVGLDGTVTVNDNGTVTNIGTIQTVRFPNPAGLKSIGKNLLLETDASGAPVPGQPHIDFGYGSIAQGYLEMSNVKAVEEMVKMIVAQRAYELNSKVIQTGDAMLQTANTLKR